MNSTQTRFFCSCDLDLDPMTVLINQLDLKIPKMYHTKNELHKSRLSKVRALQTDRHTDRRDRKQYHAALADGNNIC